MVMPAMVMTAKVMLPLPTRNQSMQVMTRQMHIRIIQRRGELALKTIQAVMKPKRIDNNLAEQSNTPNKNCHEPINKERIS